MKEKKKKKERALQNETRMLQRKWQGKWGKKDKKEKRMIHVWRGKKGKKEKKRVGYVCGGEKKGEKRRRKYGSKKK